MYPGQIDKLCWIKMSSFAPTLSLPVTIHKIERIQCKKCCYWVMRLLHRLP